MALLERFDMAQGWVESWRSLRDLQGWWWLKGEQADL